jgi:mRNA deadenylase 3'-5' endonuclease subunit Ccr4
VGFDGSYGGFTHLTQPEVVLNYDLRKWRLLHVLLGGGIVGNCKEETENCQFQQDSIDPFDIVALQEVDDYYSFWHPLLVCDQTPDNGIKKYQGVFQPKPFSPCIKFGWYSDGVALFWNVQKFSTIARPSECGYHNLVDAAACDVPKYYWIEMGSFRGDAPCNDISIHDPTRTAARNQVYIIAPLRHVASDQIVIVATTHLKAKKGYTNERIRLLQALELKNRVKEMAHTLQLSCGRRDIQIIMLGDFNSEPDDSSVQCILEHDDTSRWNMQSAYNLQNEKLYTTWKARKGGSVCRTIDYIFHSGASEQSSQSSGEMLRSRQLVCDGVLSVPEKESVDELLPGFRYPSDHLLIAARFDLI